MRLGLIRNGYEYAFGRYNRTSAINQVDFAQIGSNGALVNALSSCPDGGALTGGTWCSTSPLLSNTADGGTATHNGYIYLIGVGSTTAVDYAPINSNGTLGTWTATAQLTLATYGSSSEVYEGYVLAGYDDGTNYAVDYAAINFVPEDFKVQFCTETIPAPSN